MRRKGIIIVAIAAIAAAAVLAVVLARRTVRWNDARTMPPPLAAAVKAYGKGNGDEGRSAVRQLLRRYRAPAWEPRARVLAATELARDGRDRDILDWLPKDFPVEHPLASHALLLRARGFLARGEHARAADLAQRAAAVRDFPGADEARRVRAEALEADGQWRAALDLVKASPESADALEASRILASHGDAEGARRLLVASLLDAKTDGDAARIAEALTDLISDPPARLSVQERPSLAEKARRLLDDGRPAAALGLVELVLPEGSPSAATAAESLIEAEALLKLARAAEIGPWIARARTADPAHLDGVRYLEAKRAAAASSFGAYRAGLEAVGRSGTSPWKERALLDLARNGEGVPSAATLQAYRRYRTAAGASADPLAILREAWAAYDLGKTQDAAAAFALASSRRDAPDGVKATAGYWRARIDDGAGRAAAARAGYASIADTYPNQYYGTLAAKRLGRPKPTAPADLGPPKDPAALGDDARWLLAARELVSVGLWSDASPCYRQVMRHAGTAGAAIALEAASAAKDAGAQSDAVSFAQEIAGERDRTRVEDLPLGVWRLLYPAPNGDAIAAAAKSNGLDPDLVAAVALQESAFNPLAVSSAGARGLLQVMPAVGAELARSAGMKQFDADDLFDPAVNLKLGCAHLQEYVRRFSSVPLALAAYNGGPSRVERWGGGDDERFVERIPIPETRLYVKRVLVGARMYAVAWPRGLGAD